jgi:hypothetical protein
MTIDAQAFDDVPAIDHRLPLFRVWSKYRDAPRPKLLDYWGLPNLQMINRDVHVEKCAVEAGDRRDARYLASQCI